MNSFVEYQFLTFHLSYLHLVERWDLPKCQHGRQSIFLEPVSCRYAITYQHPPLCRGALVRTVLCTCFPPRPEAKSSEVATLSLSGIGGKPWWFEACCINGRCNCNAFGLLQEHANRVGRPRLPSGNTHVIFMSMLETEFILLPQTEVISRPQLPLGEIEMTAGGGGRGLTYGRSFRRACKLGTANVAASMDER